MTDQQPETTLIEVELQFYLTQQTPTDDTSTTLTSEDLAHQVCPSSPPLHFLTVHTESPNNTPFNHFMTQLVKIFSSVNDIEIKHYAHRVMFKF